MGLERGSFLRHPVKGDAVVLGTRPGKVDVLFESNERATLSQTWTESNCKLISVADLNPSSPLRDESIREPRTAGALAGARSVGSSCSVCEQPLNRSQYASGKRFKSCPKCSVDAGVHVFHAHPDAFGTTEARANIASPEGVQSYCTACRTGQPAGSGTSCREIAE
jgi:hypothetical protein